MNQLDTDLFLWLNSLHNSTLDPIMEWISGRNSWIPLYVLIIGLLVWRYKSKSVAILIAVILSVVLSDQICSSFFKPLVQRLRPCHEPAIQHLVHVVGNCGGQFGFCSSHAANSFTLAMSLLLLIGKDYAWVKILFVWAIIISYSRIYVGVHYPLDVLAGAGVGVMSAFISFRLYQYYLLRVNHEKP